MKTIANFIWILVAGLWLFIIYSIIALILCISIIGIPFGAQCFKIGVYALTPFGRNARINFKKHPLANIIWLIFVGWESAIFACVAGIILCITIIGIPLGIKCFDFATLLLCPFGAKI